VAWSIPDLTEYFYPDLAHNYGIVISIVAHRDIKKKKKGNTPAKKVQHPSY
jgi:hypothetical protein